MAETIRMVAYTGGTFDIPHIGHCIFFEQCKLFFPNSYLVVSVNTDEFVEKFKGKPPIFSYEERVSYLKNISFIDKIVKNYGGEDSKPVILEEKTKVILIGSDWLEKDYCKQMSFTPDWLAKNRIALCYIPRYGGLSATLIKERLAGEK